MSDRRARALVAVTALGYAVAAVFAALGPFRIRNVPPMRTVQTPGLIAGAVVLVTFAALALLGLLLHRLLILECGILVGLFLVGNYASDNPLGLIGVASVIALFAAYRVLREKAAEIPPSRLVVFALSTLVGIAALWATHYQPRFLTWDRTHEGARNISIITHVFDGTCGTQPSHEISSATRDSGCGEFIPKPAALTAGVLCLGCVLLAAAGASLGNDRGQPADDQNLRPS